MRSNEAVSHQYPPELASPAPVLGLFALTFLALAEEPLRVVEALSPPVLFEATAAEAVVGPSVLESKSFTASRTRDFLPCEEVGRTGPVMGEFLTLTVVPLLG